MNADQAWKAQAGKPTLWDRWSADVLIALRQDAPSPKSEILDLPIPQNQCCFSFGKDGGPLPAGAALWLWREDTYATGDCPSCGGDAVAIAFGGLLSVGGYVGLCLNCGKRLFRWIGGLAAVGEHIGPFLKNSPWPIKSARFGGAFASDGAALARSLGLLPAPNARRPREPHVKVGRHRLVLNDVQIPRRDQH